MRTNKKQQIRYININYNIDNMNLARTYNLRSSLETKNPLEINLQLALLKEFYNLLLEKSTKTYKEGRRGMRLYIYVNTSINILYKATTIKHMGRHAYVDMTYVFQQELKRRIEELRIYKIHSFQDAVMT